MESTRYGIVACVLTLMCIGIVSVYSAGASLYGADRGYLGTVQKQMVWLVLSAAVLFVAAGIDYHLLSRHARAILVASFALLVLVHIVGQTRNGARRWIVLGPVSMQPAEFFKLAVVVYMAWFLSAKEKKIRQFLHGFLPPVLLATLGFLLIIAQPDFGTAVLTTVVVFSMLLVAGVNLMHALPMLLAAAPVLGYLIVTVDYRLRRVLVFLNPWQDPQGAGYHIIQSMIAFGAGGLLGVGPGNGMQKGGYTPEHLTDFLLSVIGEETGFVGTACVVMVFLALFYLGARVVVLAADAFGSLLAFGIMLTIALQTFINIGVVTGMLPTKGLPLPFMSYGGSSMLVMAAGVGIVLNVASHIEEVGPVPLLGAEREGL